MYRHSVREVFCDMGPEGKVGFKIYGNFLAIDLKKTKLLKMVTN
jgi:hypothetical protein